MTTTPTTNFRDFRFRSRAPHYPRRRVNHKMRSATGFSKTPANIFSAAHTTTIHYERIAREIVMTIATSIERRR